MERLPEPSGIKRNKKACTECRQQKVRCDAKVDSTDPCSRCRKMKLQCVISDPFKREHKRQRLSELEHEAYELRRRLESQSSWPVQQLATPTASTESSIRLTPFTNNPLTSPVEIERVAAPTPIADDSSDEKRVADTQPTKAQMLDGCALSPAVIDELFARYFQDFHQFVPFLDMDVSPNEYFRRSKFLFWAIIVVACRNWSKDPTLLDSIGEKVLNLALMSLRHATIPTVKGLLLILTWPFPKNPHGNIPGDISHVLCGAILHMAMQIGLHIPTSSQDFSRVKVHLTEAEIAKRAELWGYCIVTYQRACSIKGHSPLSLLDLYQDAEQRHALFCRISPTLRYQLKLNSLITRCCSAMLQSGLRLMSKDQEHSLDILIRVFEANLKDVETEAVSGEFDKFYLYVSRLTVQVFSFYKEPPKTNPNFMLTRLYSTSCLVLRHIDQLAQSGFLKLTAAPFFFTFAADLASVTILRLLKGSTAQYLDIESAKEMFFLGVNLLKRLSVESNDIANRMAMVLTQLWNSEKAFKNPDGSEHTALRIRTRLAMSPVFDVVWWWREEFGGQQGAYPLSSLQPFQVQSPTIPDAPQPDAHDVSLQAYSNTAPPTQPYQEFTNFLDDQLLAELGWTNSTNYLYPNIPGPIGTDWYSPTNMSGFAL